jgi:transcriptional regulator with XRE-family HTH domain
MGGDPSIALQESQVSLHCANKVLLYPIGMTLGKRIKRARERLAPRVTQRHVADAFSISDKAVSAWERDDTIPELSRLPTLARLLKVPVAWLLEGTGEPPPSPDDLEVRIEMLSPAERAIVIATVDAMHRQRGEVA